MHEEPEGGERRSARLVAVAALAAVLATNPGLLQLKIVEANARALQPTDKLIFTPDGTTPTIVLPGPGIVPTVDTASTAASNPTQP